MPVAAERRRAATRRRLRGVDLLTVLTWLSAAVAVTLWLATPGSHTVAGIGGWLEAGGIVAGLIGTDLVLVMLVLAARVPVIDRLIGQDVAIAHHRTLGKPVLYLLLAHGALLTLGYGIGDGTGPIAETVALFGSQDMPLAYLSIGLFVVVVGTSIVAVRRRLPYEAWHVIHLLSYAAVLVAFPHMTTGSVLGAGSWQRAYWIALYVAAFGLVALYRFVLPVVVTFRHRIRVVGVEPIAPGVVSIHMAGRDLDALGAHGGQYGVWRFWSRQTWWHAHPVSFSAVPSRNGVRITVRDLGAGSARLGRIRPGTAVSLEGPYGLFTKQARSAPKLALVASGIGITPIRALLEDADLRPGEATVLLRGSDSDQQYLWEETAELARRTGSRVYGMVGPRAGSAESWMTEDDLRRGVHLRSVFPDLLDSDLYVCGPQVWTDLVVAEARAAGVPEHRIHQERFAS
ncbi:oxidoreductase [Curtobacterium citreum]|nr:oxidoreductase [Curtobacterium citreum]